MPWKKTDNRPSVPGFLLDSINFPSANLTADHGGLSMHNDLNNAFFVDTSEAGVELNRQNGLKTPGWTLFKEYGNGRRYVETLVVIRANPIESGDDGVTGNTYEEDQTVVDAFTSSEMFSTSFNGATFVLSGVIANGVYADGSPWVSGNGTPVTLLTSLPQTTYVSRLNEDGLPTKNEDALTGATRVHGAMLNPGNAIIHGSLGDKSTLAGRQLLNFGHQGAGSSQGFDSYTGEQTTFSGYDDSENIAGAPVELMEGTIVKAISVINNVSKTGRPSISSLAPLTVVSAIPPANSFRPAVALNSKTSLWTVDDLRMDRLPNLSSVGLVNLRNYEQAIARANFVTWQHTYNVASRNIIPLYAPIYGGDRDAYFADMLALCYDFWTYDQKLEVTKKLVQLGIDIAGRVSEGAIYTPNGGHDVGYKALVAFAAYMLNDDPVLVSALNTLVLVSSYNNKNPVNTSIWSDDQKVFAISQSLIDTSVGQPLPYTQDQLGLPEWAGDGLYAGRNLIQNHLGLGLNPNADPTNNRSYRNISSVVIVSAALPLRLMGAMPIYGNQIFFDYADRYMQYIEDYGPYDPGNVILPFVLSAWAKDRGVIAPVAVWDVRAGQDNLVIHEKPVVVAPTATVISNSIIVTG